MQFGIFFIGLVVKKSPRISVRGPEVFVREEWVVLVPAYDCVTSSRPIIRPSTTTTPPTRPVRRTSISAAATVSRGTIEPIVGAAQTPVKGTRSPRSTARHHGDSEAKPALSGTFDSAGFALEL